MSAPAFGETTTGGKNRKPRIVKIVIALVVVVLLIGGASAYMLHSASKYYLFAPGTAPEVTAASACTLHPSTGELALPSGEPCVRVKLPAGKVHAVSGKVLMVDVEVGPASPLDWLRSKVGLLPASEQLVPYADFAGTTPPSQLACQDQQQMAGADQAAALAALGALGYHVSTTSLGAQIDLVEPGTAADAAGIQCNDLVTAVDGQKVASAQALGDVLAKHSPGDRVVLTVQPASGGATKQVPVVLRTPPPGVNVQSKVFLGVALETRVKADLPFSVSVDAGAIGGPSAGLAFTLGIVNSLSDGDLTGGHDIAATGTIDSNGNVGDVGGVAQKTVAVQQAGAKVFFVPEGEYKDAMKAVKPGMKVIPVTTLRQVINILRTEYGGKPPALTPAGPINA